MSTPRCPDCSAPLAGPFAAASRDNFYTAYYTCPNYPNHGVPIPCPHLCGYDVRYPMEHYSSTNGLIGSGRWQCSPQQDDLDFERWLGEGGNRV